MVVVSCDIAFFADAFPPIAVTMVVVPRTDLGGVAVVGEYNLSSVLKSQFVTCGFEQLAFCVVEIPHTVAIALAEKTRGEQMSFLVVGFVAAEFSVGGEIVFDANLAVGVEILEKSYFYAVLKIAFEYLGTILVGLNPILSERPCNFHCIGPSLL